MKNGNTFLIVGVELLGVGLLTLLAGASDDAGNIVIIFMVGLWLIYMVTNPGVISGLSSSLQDVTKQANG
jgi:hypothetical protein